MAGDLSFNPINGNLTVNVGAVVINDKVTVDVDSSNNLVITVNNNPNMFPVSGPSGKVKTISLDTGIGNDTIEIFATPAGVTTNVHGGAGVDTFNVGAPGVNFNTRFTISGILGTVNISGDADVDFLNVKDNDIFDTARVYVLSSGLVMHNGIANINYDSTVSSVNLTAGGGDDKFFVVDSNPFISVSIEAGGGNDTIAGPDKNDNWQITGTNAGTFYFNVKFKNVENLFGGSLNDLFAFSNGMGVTGKIDGAGGSDTLDYSLYASSITIDAFNSASTGDSGFHSIETVVGGSNIADKLLGAGNFLTTNTWNISSPNAGTVGNNGAPLAFKQIENLSGSTFKDLFVFSSGAYVQGVIDGGGGFDTIDYAGYLTPVAINAANKTASAMSGYANVEAFNGGLGTDTIFGLSTPSTFNITSLNAGNLAGQFSFASFENLSGSLKADSFVFSNGASLSGVIDGGGGVDTIDYSAFTTSVVVDLTAGKSTGTTGIIHVENAIGGAADDVLLGDSFDNILLGNGGNDKIAGRVGADILLGGDGDDILDGGTDRDILIGGLGTDLLTGGADDDLLIGGTTKHDANLMALDLMRNEWKRTDIGYAQRIADLRITGVAFGLYKLDAASVIDDAKLDKLTGGLGQDWFWGLSAEVTDSAIGELLN